MNRMYFIAHVLPTELNQEIVKLKTRMRDRFGCLVAMNSPAHITLVPPFWMPSEQEDPLKLQVDNFSKELTPFIITTRGFGCFKPKTIFIEPEASMDLENLKSAMDRFAAAHPEFKAKPDERKFHPHITIATRDLQRKDFREAWMMFEQKTFAASWKACDISILCHNKKNWDVIHTSQFSLS